jgi:hypothetical protein
MAIRPAYNPPILPARLGGTGYGGSNNPYSPDNTNLIVYGDGSASKLKYFTGAGGFSTDNYSLKRGAINLLANRRMGRMRVFNASVTTQVLSTSAQDPVVSITFNKRSTVSRIFILAAISLGKYDRADLGGQAGLNILRDGTNIYGTGSILCRNSTGLASPNNTRIGSFSTFHLFYEDTSPIGQGNTTYKITSSVNGTLTTFAYQWGGAPSSITVFEWLGS